MHQHMLISGKVHLHHLYGYACILIRVQRRPGGMTFMPWCTQSFCSLAVVSHGTIFDEERESIVQDGFSRRNVYGLQNGSVKASHTSYCFGLEISEEPNYYLLRDKLAVIANREACSMDIKFEWDDPDWTGECCIAMSAHSHLNMNLAAPIAPEPAPPLPEYIPSPCIKRGDIVLLKHILEKSLDYESPPRPLDSSFFPHQNLTGMEWRPPFRPAVVRSVIPEKDDPTYFTVEAYPLMQPSGLTGLSARRRRGFLPLETLIDTTIGMQVPSDNVFVYKNSLLHRFKIEYDQV